MSDDLVKRLTIKAGVMEMGEKIAWGSDTSLMREAAKRIEELEAKLAKCKALMHAGLAEYQRRLVGVIEASIAVRSAQKTYFKDRSKDNLIASKQAETSLDKLLVDLEGEIDD
jgi:ABC-type uncharacterized transport system ATPase subunit